MPPAYFRQRRETGRFHGAMPGFPALAALLVFEELFAAGQALGDLEGLALGAHGGGVGGEVAGGGDQDVDGLWRRLGRWLRAEQAELAEGGFDGLDGVEVAVFAEEELAEGGHEWGDLPPLTTQLFSVRDIQERLSTGREKEKTLA
jgi:hypothetical protein